MIQISIIVVNAVPHDGPIHYRCMICRKSYPVKPNTRQTIADLKAAKKMYVVSCKDCLPVVKPDGPAAKAPIIQGGTAVMRDLMGLEDLG